MKTDAAGPTDNYGDAYSSQGLQSPHPSQNGNGPQIKAGGNSFNTGNRPNDSQNPNNSPKVTKTVQFRPSPTGNPNDPPVKVTRIEVGDEPPGSPPLTHAPQTPGTSGQQTQQTPPQVTQKVEYRPAPSGNPNDPPIRVVTTQVGNPPPGSPPLTHAPQTAGNNGPQAQQNQTPQTYPPYTPGTNYPQGTVVSHNGNLYVKSAGDFSGAAPNGDWLPGFAWHGKAP
jgi:hypothetical protein